MQNLDTSDSETGSDLEFSGFMSDTEETDIKMPSAEQNEAAALVKAQKSFEQLDRFIQGAETDIAKAKAIEMNEDTKIMTFKAMLSRINDWIKNITEYEKAAASHTNVDGSSYIERSKIVIMDLKEISVSMEELILDMQEEKNKVVIPNVSEAAKIVRTTASEFPKFSGVTDFEIWETTWNQLATSSGLGEDGLMIKLRESIQGKAKDYIGVNGMVSLTYKELWKKLKERYAVPWYKTQEAARRYFDFQTPEDTDEAIYKFIDDIRDSLDTVERLDLKPEHLVLNAAMDCLPSRVRGPLSDKLEGICPDFKFSKSIFETHFSKVMSLQGKKQLQRHTTMYVAQNTSGQYVAQNTGNQQTIPQKQNNQQQGVGTHTGNNKGNGNKKLLFCLTCMPRRHAKNSDCPYNTPEKKRKRLVELERCQACGVSKKEHGTECSHRARCQVHPGENHYHWLCDGEKSTHPGPQQDFTMVSKNKYSLGGAVSKSQK